MANTFTNAYPLPDALVDGFAIYALPDQGEGDSLTRVNRESDRSFYGASDNFDFTAKTAEEMRAKLQKYGARYMGWERG